MHKKTWGLLALAFVLITFFTFHQSLQYGFWKDDWRYLWCAWSRLGRCEGIWLHPATPAEFTILERLFGREVLAWQYTGLMLRALLALSVTSLSIQVTKSVHAGILAGLSTSVSVIGLESVHWPSAHVTAIVAILVVISLSYWIQYVRYFNNSSLICTLIFGVLGILADPWRAIGLLPMIHLVTFLYGKRAGMLRLRRKLLYWYVVALIAFFLYAFVQRNILIETQLGKFFTGSPSFVAVLSKTKVIGHYFNSLFNLTLGWIIPSAHDGNEFSHGVYSASRAWIGMLTTGLGILGIVIGRKRYPSVGIFTLSIGWIMLFYFPVWIFDPRVITTEVHRYLVIPSVGLFVLLGYVLRRIRPLWLGGTVTVLFISMNIYSSQHLLGTIAFFRSESRIDFVWSRITRLANDPATKSILILNGEEPIRTNAFLYYSRYAFALKRGIRAGNDLPEVTEDYGLILSYLCREHSPLPLGSVFAWHLDNDGRLREETDMYRERIRNVALRISCRV